MGLAITHWKDKEDVFMMTTCIPDSKTILQKRGVETTVPTVVHTHNNMMGDVDRSKQMTTSYPTEHKPNKEVVQETFHASYKHIFIQCSHHKQKERRQIG